MTTLPDGSEVRKLPEIPEDIAALHWSEAIIAAHHLDQAAEGMMAQAREQRRLAIAVRLRAERERDAEEAKAPKADHTDRLLAAAGLAVEDLPAGFEPGDLAEALGIKDNRRALAMLLALEHLGHVRREGKGSLTRWHSLDPYETQARDFARQHGTFHAHELAEHLGVPVAGADHYINLMVEREQIHRPGEDGSTAWEWLKTGPERTVTRRPRHTPPEATVHDLAPKRGATVEGTGQPIGAAHKSKIDSDRKRRGVRVKRRPQKGRS